MEDNQSNNNANYYLDLVQLKIVHSHRDLGVLIDENLKFHSHIRSFVNHAAGLASNLLKSTVC